MMNAVNDDAGHAHLVDARLADLPISPDWPVPDNSALLRLIGCTALAVRQQEWYGAQACSDALYVEAERRLLAATHREPWYWFRQSVIDFQRAILRSDQVEIDIVIQQLYVRLQTACQRDDG